VLALPSWSEGTPNVILEALACGRRVLATRVGGIPDLVTSAEQGELVPARDPDALVAALARAADTRYDQVPAASAGSWAESARRLEASLRAAVA
jgi:glycosyltransferase involved in cell wall biosynthesis